jgi:hypothetical protein
LTKAKHERREKKRVADRIGKATAIIGLRGNRRSKRRAIGVSFGTIGWMSTHDV